MLTDDTIAAISTPPGLGAIAIVRLSGPLALAIARKIFLPRIFGEKNSPQILANATVAAEEQTEQNWLPTSHLATIGYIYNRQQNALIDEVVLIPYVGPNSYTGEDLVEINCHGSPIVTREILNLCLEQGARLAQAGEFTKRGFLAGKIDLTQAEAVLDLIHSKTERQSRLALSVLKGHLGSQIKIVRQRLMELLTRIIAGIDFPEEVGEVALDDIEEITADSIKRLQELARTARSGRYLREGLKLAIVGRPNAGKSSLLNCLLSFERAIVTDIPGTTRDSIEEPVDLNGIPVILIDTAGVRNTEDTVEMIGIERTARSIESADLVVFLIDSQKPLGDEETVIARHLEEFARPCLIAFNKCDLVGDSLDELKVKLQALLSPGLLIQSADYQNFLKISARYGQGIEDLKGAIESWVLADSGVQELGGSLNQRQGQLCLRAVHSLQALMAAQQSGLPQDCLATDLRTAVDALDELSGETVTEEVITEVFANFCIGK